MDMETGANPTEARELAKKNCIFCHIIAGEVSSKKIYEDESVLAILDINPANPGHILLLSKEHYLIMPQMPEELISHLAIVGRDLSHRILRGLKVSGTNIFVANGAIAGQRAPHFMMHIIPRDQADEIESFSLREHQKSSEELFELQKLLVPYIAKIFGREDLLNILQANELSKLASIDAKKENKKEKMEKQEKEASKASLDDIAHLFLKK